MKVSNEYRQSREISVKRGNLKLVTIIWYSADVRRQTNIRTTGWAKTIKKL